MQIGHARCSLHELAGRGRLEFSVRMRDAIDSCVDIGIAKGYVECQSVIVVGIRVCPSNNLWLVCDTPGITPGDLTSLTGLPAGCSSGVVNIAGKRCRNWGGQHLCSRGGCVAVA